MLDWVSQQPQAQLDRPGDPRVGMVGYSYGGGIQLTLASIDCRVDAIVPGLAWNSLGTSLYKASTVKAGWSRILTSLVDPTHLDPHIVSAAKSGLSNGTLSPDDLAWFLARGPGKAVADIHVPTLFVSGTVDTLFTLDEAVANYETLRRHGVPTAMLWFCGGHGTCLTNAGDQQRTTVATFAWLNHYLKDDPSVALGPAFDTIDQDGVRWTAQGYPVAMAAPVTASGSGTLALTAASQAGPLTGKSSGDLLSGLVGPVTPAKAATAINVAVDPGSRDALALGPPTLDITYSGTTTTGPRPKRVFAQLVDDTLGVVVGNQITPIALTLDGKVRHAKVAMELIVQHLEPGHTLTLQIVATTPAYATPQLGGSVTFSQIGISIPVASGVTKR
jgi:ABC-2 type transport system ATP-binding protein